MAVEAASLELHTLGLTGFVSDAISCLKSLEVGDRIGKDPPGCILDLDILRSRLVCWAHSVNTLTQQQSSLEHNTKSDRDIEKRILGNISRFLKENKGIWEKFKEDAAPDNVPFRGENLGALEAFVREPRTTPTASEQISVLYRGLSGLFMRERGGTSWRSITSLFGSRPHKRDKMRYVLSKFLRLLMQKAFPSYGELQQPPIHS